MMLPTPKSPILFLAFTVAFVLIAGCDSRPPCFPVSGKIKFEDDSPAQFGAIEFRSETEPPAISRGLISKDGSFSAKSPDGRTGLIAGKHKVIIMQIIGSPRGGGTIVHHHGLEVATRYNNYKTSGLEIEVTPDGENEFELIVDSK